jgi:hypothetical protein
MRDAPYSSEAPSLSISRAMFFHRLSFFDETVEPADGLGPDVFEPVAPALASASSAGGVTRDRASCCLSFGTDVGGSAFGGAFDVRRVCRISKHGVLEDGKGWRPGARGFGDREATPPLGRAEADASAADMAVRGGTARPAARTRVKPRESPTCFSRRNSQRVSGESPRKLTVTMTDFSGERVRTDVSTVFGRSDGQNQSRTPFRHART